MKQRKSYICSRLSLSFSIMIPRDLAVSLTQIQRVQHTREQDLYLHDLAGFSKCFDFSSLLLGLGPTPKHIKHK